MGVEHAAPEVVRAALAAPRRSDPQRLAFSREQLLAWGLVAELGERVGCAGAGVGLRAGVWRSISLQQRQPKLQVDKQ